MRHSNWRHVIFCLFASTLIFSCRCHAQQTESAIIDLIDQLQSMDRSDYEILERVIDDGYSPHWFASASWIDDEEASAEVKAFIEIVSYGREAVPVLLDHLGDNRETQLKYRDAYLKDSFDYESAWEDPVDVDEIDWGDTSRLEDYTVKIGDICLVALGQIVNRHYEFYYGYITSPVEVPEIRAAANASWQGFFEDQQYLDALVKDFTLTRQTDRRIGAYERLAYHFPETAETLAIDYLSKITVEVKRVEHFVTRKLLRLKTTEERRAALDEFVETYGEHYSQAVVHVLFRELREVEESEREPPSFFSVRKKPYSREALINLFDFAETVISDDYQGSIVPAAPQFDFVDGLKHDSSLKITKAIKELYLRNPHHKKSHFCLSTLAWRGCDEFLLEQLEKVDPTELEHGRKEMFDNFSAIEQSKDVAVQKALLEKLLSIPNDKYLMIVYSYMEQMSDEELADVAQRYFQTLPNDSYSGDDLLIMFRRRDAAVAKQVFDMYLKPGTVERISTACHVLKNWVPTAQQVLLPYLDDRREAEGWREKGRVCDRAARTINENVRAPGIALGQALDAEQLNENIRKLKIYLESNND